MVVPARKESPIHLLGLEGLGHSGSEDERFGWGGAGKEGAEGLAKDGGGRPAIVVASKVAAVLGEVEGR